MWTPYNRDIEWDDPHQEIRSWSINSRQFDAAAEASRFPVELFLLIVEFAVTHSGDEIYKSLANNVNPRWTRDPGLRRLNLSIAMMFASAAANGYDGTLINGLLSNTHFKANLGDISSALLGIIVAGISLGGTPVFIPASYVGDIIGRVTW